MRGDKVEDGRMADATGLSQAEPEVSALRASIPCPGMFGVLNSYDFPVVEITKVSEQCFWSKGGRHRGDRETRAYLEKLAAWSHDRSVAEKVSRRLVSAEAERNRRLQAARIWFEREKKKITAPAIEARSDATGTGAAEGESAVPKGGAPDSPSPPPQEPK